MQNKVLGISQPGPFEIHPFQVFSCVQTEFQIFKFCHFLLSCYRALLRRVWLFLLHYFPSEIIHFDTIPSEPSVLQPEESPASQPILLGKVLWSVIFVHLLWTHHMMTMCLSDWETQDWPQYCVCDPLVISGDQYPLLTMIPLMQPRILLAFSAVRVHCCLTHGQPVYQDFKILLYRVAS